MIIIQLQLKMDFNYFITQQLFNHSLTIYLHKYIGTLSGTQAMQRKGIIYVLYLD